MEVDEQPPGGISSLSSNDIDNTTEGTTTAATSTTIENLQQEAKTNEEDEELGEQEGQSATLDKEGETSIFFDLSDDVKCPVCLDLLFEPMIFPCQHCVCRGCFQRLSEQTLTSCPTCRNIVHYQPGDAPYCRSFQALLEKAFPEDTERRRAEIKEIDAPDPVGSLPLFVVGMIAWPFRTESYHIFEPRYRLMFRRVLQSPTKVFGSTFHDSEGDVMWGTICRITSHDFLPDGRSVIECYAMERFRVVSVTERDNYSVGQVEIFEDNEAPEGADTEELKSAVSRLLSLAAQLSLGSSLEEQEFFDQLYPQFDKERYLNSGRSVNSGRHDEEAAAYHWAVVDSCLQNLSRSSLLLASLLPNEMGVSQLCFETQDPVFRMLRMAEKLPSLGSPCFLM